MAKREKGRGMGGGGGGGREGRGKGGVLQFIVNLAVTFPISYLSCRTAAVKFDVHAEVMNP